MSNQPEHEHDEDEHAPPPLRRMAEGEYIVLLRILEKRVARNERALATIVQSSVSDGIKAAVSDKAMWDAFFAALADRAQDQAGSFTMGGIKWVARKILWGAIITGVIYAVGGWPLLVKWVTGK